MLPHYTKTSVRPFRGHTPKIGNRVLIDPMALVLGNVTLGDDVSVWPGAVVRGDMHRIVVGDRCSIQDGSVLHITHASDYNPGGWPLIIGDEVTIGHNATVHGCTVGDRVLIGMGAVILDRVQIENDVIIAAGAVVPPKRVLASGFLYAGTPARQMRPLSDSERSFFSYTAGNYVRLKDEHIYELESV